MIKAVVMIFFAWPVVLPVIVRVEDVPRGGSHRYEITSAQIFDAMKQETHYDVTATTNVARFQANVILRLVRTVVREDSTIRFLSIRHDDWFDAYLKKTNLTLKTAPLFTQLASKFGQDQLIEYAPKDIVKNVKKGRKPVMALNILVFWPKTSNLPNYYAFDDTLASPKLRVKNERLISYRLLDFGDMIVFDEVKGLAGRPTTGVLGLLFKVIGDGRVVHSRLLETEEGLLFAKTKAVKGFFSSKPTVTIRPDGKMEKGLNTHPKTAAEFESRLNEAIEISYNSQLSERDIGQK